MLDQNPDSDTLCSNFLVRFQVGQGSSRTKPGPSKPVQSKTSGTAFLFSCQGAHADQMFSIRHSAQA